MNTVIAYIVAGMIVLSGVIALFGLIDAFRQISRMDNNDNQNLKQ